MNAEKQKSHSSQDVADALERFGGLKYQNNAECQQRHRIGVDIDLEAKTGTISNAPVVVPRLAPKMMPIPAARVMSPALRKEIAITETSELDCISVVLTIPNSTLFPVDDVVRRSIRSRVPPVKARKPSSSDNMPNRKLATPAAIILTLGLTQKP